MVKKQIVDSINNRLPFRATAGVDDMYGKPLPFDGCIRDNNYEIWHNYTRILVVPIDSICVSWFRKTAYYSDVKDVLQKTNIILFGKG